MTRVTKLHTSNVHYHDVEAQLNYNSSFLFPPPHWSCWRLITVTPLHKSPRSLFTSALPREERRGKKNQTKQTKKKRYDKNLYFLSPGSAVETNPTSQPWQRECSLCSPRVMDTPGPPCFFFFFFFYDARWSALRTMQRPLRRVPHANT